MTIFCKHYQAMYSNETCKAGVDYNTLPHHGTRQFHDNCPCFNPEQSEHCPKSLYPSPAEQEARAEEHLVAFACMGIAREAIVDSIGGPWSRGKGGVAGKIDCPICGQPKSLRFSRSAINGHIHAGCTTPNCVAWME